MQEFANRSDVAVLMRLTAEQKETADILLKWVSDRLRYEAKKVGKDLDAMIAADESLATVAKAVTAGIVERTLKAADNDMVANMSQFSQSAGGYTVSGSVANPGESLYIKRSELKALGITRNGSGVIDPYGICNQRDSGCCI